MSRWLNKADEIRDRILARVPACSPDLPEAERVAVIVDRQKSISTEIAKGVASASGAVITILWIGGRNPQPEKDVLKMGANYSIMIRTSPVLREGNVPADELAEAVALALHGWAPGEPRLTRRMQVTDVDMVPDRALLIYEVTASILRL